MLIYMFSCISDEDIKNKIIIDIYFGNKKKEHHRQILLNNNKRFMRAFEKEDVTMIKIIDDDRISSDKYLAPDLKYIDKNKYLEKNLYLAGYPKNHNERCISFRRITRISKNKFYHNLDTRPGSSGSPIINDKGYVIGIHTSGIEELKENKGIFIGKILDNLKINRGNNNKVNRGKEKSLIEDIPQDPYLFNKFLLPKSSANLNSYQHYQSQPHSPLIIKPPPPIYQPLYQDPKILPPPIYQPYPIIPPPYAPSHEVMNDPVNQQIRNLNLIYIINYSIK